MSGIAPVDRVSVVIPVLRDDSAHHPHNGTDPDGRNRPGGHQPRDGMQDESPGVEKPPKPPASPNSPQGRIVNTFAMCARRGGAHRRRRGSRLSRCNRLPPVCAAGGPRVPRSRDQNGRQNSPTPELA